MGKNSNDLLIPLLKAAGIHVLMFTLLFVSFHPTMKDLPADLQAKPAPMIKATAISSEVIEKLVKQKQQKKDAVVKAESDRKKRIRREADRKKKAALDKKRKKLADDKKRKKLADDKKREADVEKKRKADAEKKRKADAEKKRKADAEKLRLQKLEYDRQAKLSAERNAAREKQVLSEAQKYIGLIKGKINRNWIKPNQKEICVLNIRLGPGGIVLDVKTVSGVASVCRSAIAAVYKSDPLPVSKAPDVFKKMRNIELEFDPQEK